MSKILPASCEAGFVSVEGLVITPATILSAGVKASVGAALIEKETVTYMTSNATDIQDIITKLDDILTKLTMTLTLMDAALLTPGAGTTGIAQITLAQAELLLIKDNLK